MNYLILSQPSEDYGWAISHELWMLSRPRAVSSVEVSQFFCGVSKHTDGRVAIGPLDETQSVHADADDISFASLISASVTSEEEAAIVAEINAAKGSSIGILSIIQASPSLSPNIRTLEQLEADGWFSAEEPI